MNRTAAIVVLLISAVLLAVGLLFLCAATRQPSRFLLAGALVVVGGGLAAWGGTTLRRLRALDPENLSDRITALARAERRLRRAAQMAGFREVAFELEPVAAALHYELTAGIPQNILVFDFGGGTLDITVMRIGEPGRGQVFATGGVAIAGAAFDQRIIEGLLLDHFGRGSTWGDDAAPLPRPLHRRPHRLAGHPRAEPVRDPSLPPVGPAHLQPSIPRAGPRIAPRR